MVNRTRAAAGRTLSKVIAAEGVDTRERLSAMLLCSYAQTLMPQLGARRSRARFGIWASISTMHSPYRSKSKFMNATVTAAKSGPSGLRVDVIAGITAAAVVLPKAIAYATVAGLPVAVGLYTAFVPMVVYALLGSSRVLSVSSTATLAILVGTQLGLVVPDGDPAKLATATATLAALVGVILIAARLLRLGFVANFISTPVLTGFKAGVGFVILLDQFPKLLGIHITKHSFFVDLISVAQHIPETSMLTLLVAIATFAVLIGMDRLWPHSPAPLVAVGGGIAAAWFFGLSGMGVSTVGAIPKGFPP